MNHPIFQEAAMFSAAAQRLSARCDQASAVMRELCVTPNRWHRKLGSYAEVQRYMSAYEAYPRMPETSIDSPEMVGYFDAEKDATWREEARAEAADARREREEW